jgi:hypothetical protein
MEKTTNLNLTMLSQYQTGAFFALNSNLNIIDSVLNCSLKGDVENGENSPPANPEDHLYLVGQNASEAWADSAAFSGIKKGMLAKSNGGNGWIFIKPKNGLLLWHEDDKKLYVYTSGSFKSLAKIE